MIALTQSPSDMALGLWFNGSFLEYLFTEKALALSSIQALGTWVYSSVFANCI
jgi:hypothetical protein